MDKKNSAMKTVIAAGAASAFCGITLYAVGQVLSFLFRDVDPSRIEKKPENELEGESEEAKAEETEYQRKKASGIPGAFLCYNTCMDHSNISQIIIDILIVFMILGAIDKITRGKLKLGLSEKFEEGINALGALTLAMVGMICLAPAIAPYILAVTRPVYQLLSGILTVIVAMAFMKKPKSKTEEIDY